MNKENIMMPYIGFWWKDHFLLILTITLMCITCTTTTTSSSKLQSQKLQTNDNVEATIYTETINDINLVRHKRAAVESKVGGIFGFFQTFQYFKNLFNDQYNETTSALQRVFDVVADGFTDTHKSTLAPTPIKEPSDVNETTSTTTEKYRISRKEFGYILGKNYRGLRKLFRIEWNDALNQSKYTIQDYKTEYGNAIAPYTIKKPINDTTSNSL